MSSFYKTFLAFVFLAALWSCKKKQETPPASATPMSFTALKASPDTIVAGKTTNITTSASGGNLKYTWSTNHGDLFGSGSSIIYSSAACCVGTNTVTCVVSDGTTSSTKSIPITITL